MISQDERKRREALSDHEEMIEAQEGCVPCKLCGGKAIITDAGPGSGYYVRCENSGAFRASVGCMVTDRRLGGWAYNVMDWWNRLHSLAAPAALGVVAVGALRAAAQTVLDRGYVSQHIEEERADFLALKRALDAVPLEPQTVAPQDEGMIEGMIPADRRIAAQALGYRTLAAATDPRNSNKQDREFADMCEWFMIHRQRHQVPTGGASDEPGA